MTCRTCSLGDVNACFQAKASKSILTTDCNSVAFEIELATTPDAQGNSLVVSYNAIQPKCSKCVEYLRRSVIPLKTMPPMPLGQNLKRD